MTFPKHTPKFTRNELNVYRGPSEVSQVTHALRGVGRNLALVPTMGALHDGHRELIRRAKRLPNTIVAVSIFVNPLQFGEGEDFDAYPRSLDQDLDTLRELGVELVFAPEVEQLYGESGVSVTLDPGQLGAELEGEMRPGHFGGVLTVVAKLLNIVRPHYAFFGEKDYQQLVLVKRMAADLNLETGIVGVPTVREEDGLALSSRNAYLSEEDRRSAAVLSTALGMGVNAGADGAEAVLEAARTELAAHPEIEIEYLELRGTDLGPAPVDGDARLLIAAKVGRTRLIDNTPVPLGAAAMGLGDQETADGEDVAGDGRNAAPAGTTPSQ
ncbi:pantoate--beta-alanine ligase [Prauserella halophila]|uniref:Pantothenate synthetase n=1 Tax=Prauserella halophila TaxID=185641 RepID=A0ABN1W8S4_9PSEU|nr:pantoate--beta-alanine ligase [Prauserella halophila]MCP2235507.1 pantoate--beta-alanine ligase [Prauserella halophila]